MKGFGVIKPFEQVGWVDKEVPVLGPYDALLEPVAICPCTSDVHTAYDIPATPNRILGHEAVGRVIKVGSEVKDFKVGDVVAVPAVTPKWRSLDVQDSYHQHAGGLFQGMQLSSGEDGCMAECFKVNDIDMNVAKVPDGVALEAAVLVGDMVTTGFHGAELADIKFGDSVCVIGIGPVGLMAVAGSALRGAGKLFAVGSRPVCVELAKEYGATDVIDYKNGPIAEQVLKLNGGHQIDVVIIAGGGTGSIEEGFNMVRPGGTVVNIEVQSDPEGLLIPTFGSGFGCGHKKFIGGLCPGGRRRMGRLFDMILEGRIDPSKMITHKFYGLDACEDAFYLMRDKPKDLIKPIVYFDKKA
ncbi:NADP-dependent isopropanol dehydrogenase [Methanosarcinaceae archaeon Ag5]|uniref:NADP-dependent isopropanol dehydrogenase n=1 Tax=Methanolapillus africanus TaxID=3028297 RepID=A0AAE4SE08_9EURY|nr:NADP-dependent isopropanol dehydrogenase [Methanosarcinaceae archaeon Ag5]